MSASDVVKFCEYLGRLEQNRGTNALGFIPRTKLEHYHRRGQVLVATENGDLCGMLIHGTGRNGIMRIHQAAVEYDARRIHHGLGLVEQLAIKATAAGCHVIRLRCADDLPSNAFWLAAGFFRYGQTLGGKRRGRLINLYERVLDCPRLFIPPDEENE